MPRLRWTLLLVCLLTVAPAHAAERPPRTVGLNRRGPLLLADVGLQDLFAPEDNEKLRSGFASRILIQVELFRVGDERPLSRVIRRSDIVYDIWDEKYRVRVLDGLLVDRRVASAAEAIAIATELRKFPVAELARLQPGAPYRLRFRADLNPLSEDLVKDVRRWLVKPEQGRTGAGDSFFGSFVSIFVNPRIEDSDRQITFLSQPFSGAPEPRR